MTAAGFDEGQRRTCEVYSGALAAGLGAAMPGLDPETGVYVQVGPSGSALVAETAPRSRLFAAVELSESAAAALSAIGADWLARLGTVAGVEPAGVLLGLLGDERLVNVVLGEQDLLDGPALAAELSRQYDRLPRRPETKEAFAAHARGEDQDDDEGA